MHVLSYTLFLSVFIDQNIRLYDTSRGRFALKKTVKARDVGWSILDVCFTPDARCVLYSSWSDYSKTGTGHLNCFVGTTVIDCSNALHLCSVSLFLSL